jgi:hypothetical protein
VISLTDIKKNAINEEINDRSAIQRLTFRRFEKRAKGLFVTETEDKAVIIPTLNCDLRSNCI